MSPCAYYYLNFKNQDSFEEEVPEEKKDFEDFKKDYPFIKNYCIALITDFMKARWNKKSPKLWIYSPNLGLYFY